VFWFERHEAREELVARTPKYPNKKQMTHGLYFYGGLLKGKKKDSKGLNKGTPTMMALSCRLVLNLVDV
jgi:hypothetical protein